MQPPYQRSRPLEPTQPAYSGNLYETTEQASSATKAGTPPHTQVNELKLLIAPGVGKKPH